MAKQLDDEIVVRLTPEQHRYTITSLVRMSRSDKRGAEKIERKFQEPVKDKSLLKRLELATTCLQAFTLESDK